jgi:DNA-binding NarL/FixJ family response regulator
MNKRRSSECARQRTKPAKVGHSSATSEVLPPQAVRVLVCDDKPFIRSFLRKSLTELGFVVVGEAAGGRAAVAMALKLNPDVVIMDVSMPDLSGVEATRRILARAPEIRILGFSTDGGPEIIKEMLAAGARGFLLRTGDLVELVLAIRKVQAGDSLVGPSSRTARRISRWD